MTAKDHILAEFLPLVAIDYIEHLLQNTAVQVTITGERKYSQGTFRDKSKRGRYHITVSGTLNPYAFLITLIHEIAHLKTYQFHGRKITPHGVEWKNIFINLMMPLIEQDVFPEDLKMALVSHLKNPKASSNSDIRLVKALSKYDERAINTVFLDEMTTGQHFIWDKREFIKDETIRKRILCYDTRSRKKYLFNPIARVIPLRS